MKLVEFKKAFEDKGYDIERVLEENMQDILEELHYFNGGGFAKVANQDKKGNLVEVFLYSTVRNNPSEKTIFKHLQRSECCREWYKESLELAQDLSKEIYTAIVKVPRDYTVVLFLTPDGWKLNYFQEFEEAIQFMLDTYAV